VSRFSGLRIHAGSCVPSGAQVLEIENTIEGWQEKKAHIAHRSGGSFPWAFWSIWHLAAIWRNVRQAPKPLFLHHFFHIAERRHGR
jgi:hypothetical protein